MEHEMTMTAGIKNYMGILDVGIAVMVTIIYELEVYEAIYWYDNDGNSVLTVRPDLEEKIGCKIEDFLEYHVMMLDLKDKVSPFEEASIKLEKL